MNELHGQQEEEMKITTTTTIIECNADELRQSNSLSDAFTGILRRCFNGQMASMEVEENEDNNEED